jgi:hypothetical protein
MLLPWVGGFAPPRPSEIRYFARLCSEGEFIHGP